jgi:hypothetical protein
MRILKSAWPKYLKNFGCIRRIHYGVCPYGHDLKESLAHAHCAEDEPQYGCICLRYKYLIKSPGVMLHEVAHLIAKYKNGHNDTWRRACLRIGGTLKPIKVNKKIETSSYIKKPRI